MQVDYQTDFWQPKEILHDYFTTFSQLYLGYLLCASVSNYYLDHPPYLLDHREHLDLAMWMADDAFAVVKDTVGFMSQYIIGTGFLVFFGKYAYQWFMCRGCGMTWKSILIHVSWKLIRIMLQFWWSFRRFC